MQRALSTACFLAIIAFGALGVAAVAVAGPSQADASKPGPTDSIVDVPGIEVGQYQQDQNGYLTGTTVIYAPNRAVGGVDVAGGAPGTRGTDLLDPDNLVQRVNAVVLSGGSAYGLVTADGVMRWLREHNKGFRVGKDPSDVVPIVPAAIIFDLGRGGRFTATPTAEFGYKAIASASKAPVKQGTVGAGTGAFSGPVKGGVGTASVVLPNGYVVGALVVVNSAGSTIDPRTCRFYAESLEMDHEFHLRPGKVAGCKDVTTGRKKGFPEQAGKKDPMNTTIAVVATNAPLSKAMARRMSLEAQDGLAIAIRPVHTLYDGDTVFAMSTSHKQPWSPETHSAELNAVFVAADYTLARAIVRAIRYARSAGNKQSYCDKYPSVCK